MKIEPGKLEPMIVQPLKTKPQEVRSQPQPANLTEENFTPAQQKKMLNLIHSQPDIRPDALAKARQIAADPAYPPADVVETLAKLFVNGMK